MDAHIAADLRDHFGIAFCACAPVSGGWMNLKWRITTERGDLLVKKFSNERFDQKHMLLIEAALERQMAVRALGVPCPAILSVDGRPIRHLDDGTAYMAMAFCPGHEERPETVTCPQMESLGDASARLRAAFARLPAETAAGFPLRGAQTLSRMWKSYETRAHACGDTPQAYRAALFALEPILGTLTPAFFDRLPKGIAHEDYSRDNMLFEGDMLSAILDFDRSVYTYVWHDVGRALMSLAFDGKRLDMAKIDAFLSGYNRHLPLSRRDIADALRLVWCVEADWWVLPHFFCGDSPPKVARFRDEIVWLTENWAQIDAMLQS